MQRRLAAPDVFSAPFSDALEAHFMLTPGKVLAAMRALAAY